jgi:5'-nucleotidase
LQNKGADSQLYNLNIPTAAVVGQPRLKILPMGVARYGEEFEKRIDPRGRSYYWATNEPPPPPGEEETDLTALRRGFMTLTPLNYNMTHAAKLAEMQRWTITLD